MDIGRHRPPTADATVQACRDFLPVFHSLIVLVVSRYVRVWWPPPSPHLAVCVHCKTKWKAPRLGSYGNSWDFLKLCVLQVLMHCDLEDKMLDLALLMGLRAPGSDGWTGIQGRTVWFPRSDGCRWMDECVFPVYTVVVVFLG